MIDRTMKAEGVSYRHALELLRADLPSLEAFPEKPRGRQQGKVAKKTTTPKLPTLGERSASEEVLMREVVDYYHETLKHSPEVVAGWSWRLRARCAERISLDASMPDRLGPAAG